MIKIVFSLAFVSAGAFSSFAQRSVKELLPPHAIAVQRYLASHKQNQFLSESVIDGETLKSMRQEIRKNLKPYYLTGDFNRDGVKDFAVLFSRSGKPKFETAEEANARSDDQNLTLVVFNGNKKGGFYSAHTEDIESPLTCFLNLSDGKNPVLYFALYESDAETFMLTPVGKGYVLEYEPAR